LRIAEKRRVKRGDLLPTQDKISKSSSYIIPPEDIPRLNKTVVIVCVDYTWPGGTKYGKMSFLLHLRVADHELDFSEMPSEHRPLNWVYSQDGQQNDMGRIVE
jgi:hypothetical protein